MSKLKTWANSVLNWFLLSSANPAEASLTFKGILVGMVPTVMTLIGLTHVAVSQDMLSNVINTATLVLQDALYIVAAVMTFYGAVRKLVFGIVAVYKGIVG